MSSCCCYNSYYIYTTHTHIYTCINIYIYKDTYIHIYTDIYKYMYKCHINQDGGTASLPYMPNACALYVCLICVPDMYALLHV